MSWLSRRIEALHARLDERGDPRLESIPLPDPSPETARAVVVSFYMDNIRRGVVAAQRAALARFLPEGVAVRQIETKLGHAQSLERFLAETKFPIVVVLDINCIPIADGALERLIEGAEAGKLIGATACANHLDNGRHLFVGPFAMALSTALHAKLGKPSCRATARGDVAEEFTYAAEALGEPIEFLWPVASDDHIWELPNGVRFGHGTTYEGGVWHAFEIRARVHQAAFIERCRSFLEQAGPRPPATTV